MAKKYTYEVPVKFTFDGVFKVKAKSREEAVELVKNDCGMTMTNGVHSSLPEGNIDWEFPCHPEKEIGEPQ
ncbi:MAG: hypothetical protein WC119_00555 [Synergistaceae bacterium]